MDRGWVLGGGCVPSPENFSLLTLEKAHFGGYLMHSDVLILKSWFAVHRMRQGCATNHVSFYTAQCTLVQMRGLGIACRPSVCMSVCLSVHL